VTLQADRIAEYVQEREDALDGAVEMLDRAWAVPTPEREPETVTKPSPAPEGETWASETDWGAEVLGSSRGRTRTCDPLRRKGHAIVLGRRKVDG